MLARALLGVVAFACGFAADAENQVTSERNNYLVVDGRVSSVVSRC